jgi:hypothetical protein
MMLSVQNVEIELYFMYLKMMMLKFTLRFYTTEDDGTYATLHRGYSEQMRLSLNLDITIH